MTAVEFLTHSSVMPFSVSVTIMLMIGALEGLGLILGFALSGLLDNLVPDMDLDIETPELEHGAFSEFLTWMRIREVPVIAILLAFLTSFGVIGLAGQQFIHGTFGFMLPWYMAVPAAFIACLPGVRLFAGILGKIMPKDETSAVKSETFVGRMATITLGTAAVGSPAEAKLKDEHGHVHYFMLEPDLEGVSFNQGDAVLVVAKKDAIFTAIAPVNKHLKK